MGRLAEDSDLLRIGLVGIGFMGMIHHRAFKRVRGAKVTAIATRDPKKLAGDWTSIQGNFGPRGEVEDLTGIAAYSDWRKLVADPNVDLVDICLPNDSHAAAAIAALEAEKHVLVEKPIAVTLADATAMLAAAKKSGKTLQVAHVLPFFAEFRFAMDAILSETYGKLRAARFRRHISPPDWSAAIADAARTGGPVVDLHIHDTHFVALVAGRPKAVRSVGVVRDGVVQYVDTQYLYESDVAVTASSGALSQPSRPFTHGYEIYLEKATLRYEAGDPISVYSQDRLDHPTFAAADAVEAFVEELQSACDAVTGLKPAPHLDGHLASTALELCLAESESARTGKTIELA